jgi:hypothetical protein
MFLGFVIFLVASFDNPFRGEMSISPEAYSLILENLKDRDPANLNQPAGE